MNTFGGHYSDYQRCYDEKLLLENPVHIYYVHVLEGSIVITVFKKILYFFIYQRGDRESEREKSTSRGSNRQREKQNLC